MGVFISLTPICGAIRHQSDTLFLDPEQVLRGVGQFTTSVKRGFLSLPQTGGGLAPPPPGQKKNPPTDSN